MTHKDQSRAILGPEFRAEDGPALKFNALKYGGTRKAVAFVFPRPINPSRGADGRAQSLDVGRIPMKMWQLRIVFITMVAGLMAGCEGRTAIFPNSDPALRKTPAQFAADAAKRTYPADAPKADAEARAEVTYNTHKLLIANLSQEDWKDVEIWINQKYVVFLPKLSKFNKADGYREITFEMFYNNQGEHIPAGLFGNKVMVEKVDIVRDGKAYNVPLQLTD